MDIFTCLKNATGHGGGPGRRIQEGGYHGQEGALAETAGQHAIFS